MRKIDELNYEINSLDELKEIQKEIESNEGVAISINFATSKDGETEDNEEISPEEMVRRYRENSGIISPELSEEKNNN